MEKKEKKDNRWIFFLIAIICILTVIVLVVLFLLQGNTKVTGGGDDITSTESITCESSELAYPFFKYDNSKKKSLKIIATLNNKKLDVISLVYKLDYGNKEESVKSEAENHAAMNKSFAESGLSADYFDAKYANLGDAMQMTLYAHAKDINGMSAKYLLINGSHDFSRDTLTKNYNNQGLNCVVNNKS